MEEKQVVITKEADFVNSFLFHGQSHKLLLVSTGNIKTGFTGVVPPVFHSSRGCLLTIRM